MSERSEQGLRILVLNERDLDHPKAGGAEIHVSRIFSRLAARGHAVHQLSAGFPDGDALVDQAGVRVERLGGLLAYYTSVAPRVRRAGRNGEIDLVVECLNKVPFFAPLYAGVPVLGLCHHLFGEVAYDQVAWPIATAVLMAEAGIPRVYRDCRFLAISESTRDDLVARGIAPSAIVVSPPGIDPPTEAIARAVDPDAARPPRATYLGRLEAYKQIDVFLRAGARLVERWPDLELVVIGRGAQRGELEDLSRSLGIEGRVRFTGFVDDAERDRWLADSRVCVFPSEKEGWGLTVIEANALATPVVARNAPGLRDSVRHGETGWLVGSTDPAAWAEAMARALTEDEDTRKMRRAALDWSTRFDWERAADDMENAIRATIAGGAAAAGQGEPDQAREDEPDQAREDEPDRAGGGA